MSGCYGTDPYDRWLESQANEYWSKILVDDDGLSEEELRESAAEAAWERKQEK